jgi:hypothetical protein
MTELRRLEARGPEAPSLINCMICPDFTETSQDRKKEKKYK